MSFPVRTFSVPSTSGTSLIGTGEPSPQALGPKPTTEELRTRAIESLSKVLAGHEVTAQDMIARLKPGLGAGVELDLYGVAEKWLDKLPPQAW